MTRRRAAVLAAAVGVAALVVALLAALPEMSRRLAQNQLALLLGRPARIERVELNLFTGRFAVVGARIRERQGDDTFVAVERIAGRLHHGSLFRFDIRLRELILEAPRVRVVRTGPDAYNVSDLLDLLARADPAQPPARFTLSVDHLRVEGGAAHVEDRAVAPVADWSLQRFDAEARNISTDPRREPGALSLTARMGDVAVEMVHDVVKLAPVLLVGRVRITGLDLARLRPYAADDAPAVPEAGRAAVALNVVWKREPGRIDTAYLNGEVAADGLALSQPGRAAPFFAARRAVLRVENADLIGRTATVASAELAGVDASAARDRLGRIDLLHSTEARGNGEDAAAPPVAPGEGAAAPAWQVRVSRLAVQEARVELDDRAVAPARRWRLDDFSAEGHGLSTVAGDPPARLVVRGRVATAPQDTGAGGLHGGAALAADVTVAREADRPDAPILAGLVTLEGLAWAPGAGAAPVLAVPRASVRIARADPAARQVALAEVAVEGIEATAVRDRDGALDLVSALGAVLLPAATPEAASAPDAAARAEPAPPSAPSPPGPVAAAPGAPWRVGVERAAVSATRILVTDHITAPPRRYRVEALSLTARAVSTEPGDPPATLALAARITAPGAPGPATVRLDADRLRVAPLDASARVRVAGYDLRAVGPLLPPDFPAQPAQGVVEADVTLRLLEDGARALRADAEGRVRLVGLGVAVPGAGTTLLEIGRLEAVLRKADALAGTVEVARLEVEQPVVRVARDADGAVDLLAMVDRFAPAAAAGAPAAPAPAAAPPALASRPVLAALLRALSRPWRIAVDRLALSGGAGELRDASVSPAVQLAVTDVTLDVEQLAWPSTRPATFAVAMAMPGGGRTEARGHLQLEPLDIQLLTSTRDAPLEPYQAYFPFPARFAGRLNGDSLSEVQRGPDGVLVLASRGSAWGEGLEARAPGAAAPAVRVERLDIRNIDFSWPNYALVERIAFVRPDIRVERGPDGAINLRTLFTPDDADGIRATDPAGRDWTLLIRTDDELGPGKPPRQEGPLLETLVLDFDEIAIEDGALRFLDRTATPPLSQDLSAFHLSLKGLSNVLGRRPTSLVARAVVDGEGRLDLRGEASGINEALRADLVGELRDFPLASTNPYARSTGWIVERGRLAAKIHYRVEGDQLLAEHDVQVSGLKVEQARGDDEVERRIGLPLGLIVALLKDSRGDIDFAVPVRARLATREVDWGETYWSAFKQVLLKLLGGPFRAIGRLVTGGGDTVKAVAVEPVTFAAGSAVIAPAMETHLARVADFLRASPYVALRLTPVATAVDVDSLKTQAVVARIQAFEREGGHADFPTAVRAYLAARGVPGPPPATVDEQVAALRRLEPEPAEAVDRLLARRLEVTREALTRAEGIPDARLAAAPPAVRPEAREEGRVEFAIGAE